MHLEEIDCNSYRVFYICDKIELLNVFNGSLELHTSSSIHMIVNMRERKSLVFNFLVNSDLQICIVKRCLTKRSYKRLKLKKTFHLL